MVRLHFLLHLVSRLYCWDSFGDFVAVILPMIADLEDMADDCFVATVHQIHTNFVLTVAAVRPFHQTVEVIVGIFVFLHLAACLSMVHHLRHSLHCLL